MNPTGGQARSTPAGDAAAEVKAIVSAYADAWNRHDAAAMVSFFTEDADFVNVLGRHSRGHAELLAEFAMLHRSFMRRSALKILGASVRFLEPAVAVQHVRWELSGAEPVPGWNVPDVRRGIFTMVLVRAEDHWSIAAAQNTDIVPLPEGAIEVE